MGSEKESKSSVRLEDDSANDERTKLQVEETPAQVKGPVKNVDDFLRIGWYTLYAGTTAEFVVFNMLSNMVFMVYSGRISYFGLWGAIGVDRHIKILKNIAYIYVYIYIYLFILHY